ncbi:MAG: PAS domain S-box protein, partial [Deltaproteobacteria bacterium]|nr:PAS domain S-box protein [Deltaproteobacteria bacterium]
MKDEQKPKSQLIAELKALRQQAARQESLIAEHQRAEEARALHLRFLENMGRVDHIFRQATDIEQMMLDVLQTILEMFEADRAWLLYPCDPEAESWSVPMERTRPEYPGAFALGEEIPMLPEVANVFREALEKGDVLTINHRYQEKVYETAKQFSTLSELYMSIHPLTDKPWMFGLHQCSHYRDWTDEEENLFREIGRRLGDALNSLLILRDLRESEDRFRNLFEQSADCYFVYDLEGRFININTSLLRTYGYSKEEMLTLSVADTHLDAEQGRRVGSATFERLLATGSTQFERAFEKKSGEVFFGQVILSIIDVGGKKLVQGILRDITKHKRAEESLRESEKRYKRLVKSVTDYIYTVKVETGRPISTSHGPGCVAVTGYTTEEYDANPQLWHKMVYEEDRQAVIKQAGSVLAEADVPPLVHRIIHKDGSIRWVQNTPTRRYDEEGRLVAYDGLISNITERKRAEESLRKSEEKYRLLFENMMNGFALHQIVVNEKGKVVDYVFLEINSAFEQLTGLKRNKLIGQKVTEALPGTEKDPADWIGQYGKVALTGQEIRFDQYSQVLGKWYSVLAFSPRKGQFATIFEDITERKQAEESLRESEESLAMAQQVAHIGSWDWNIQDSRLIWSDETYRQFGLKPKEINPTYEAFEGFVHPDDREFINSAVEQALSGQKAYSVEARMVRVDGTEWIMYAQGTVYRNK